MRRTPIENPLRTADVKLKRPHSPAKLSHPDSRGGGFDSTHPRQKHRLLIKKLLNRVNFHRLHHHQSAISFWSWRKLQNNIKVFRRKTSIQRCNDQCGLEGTTRKEVFYKATSPTRDLLHNPPTQRAQTTPPITNTTQHTRHQIPQPPLAPKRRNRGAERPGEESPHRATPPGMPPPS